MKFSADRKPEFVAELQRRLSLEPALDFALLHGSAHRNQDFQDLDVAVHLLEPTRDALKTITELGWRLERGLGVPVDVHVLQEAPIEFRYQASRGEPLLARDPARLAEWKEATWNAYFREQYFLQDYTRQLMASFRRTQ